MGCAYDKDLFVPMKLHSLHCQLSFWHLVPTYVGVTKLPTYLHNPIFITALKNGSFITISV
jgi:hypothetical protein